MLDIRLLTGTLATLATLAVAAFQLLTGNAEVVALAHDEAPRTEWLTIGRLPPAPPPTAAPAQPSPAQAMEWLAFLDTVNDTRMEHVPAAAARAATLAQVNLDPDTKTDSDPAAANRRPLAVLSAERTDMEFAGPPASAIAMASVGREEAAPETTGSILLPASVRAPEPPPQVRSPIRQPVAQRATARPIETAELKPEIAPNPFFFLFPLGNVAAGKAEAYPPRDRSAIGALTPCCRRED
jgi:hypothetical protein